MLLKLLVIFCAGVAIASIPPRKLEKALESEIYQNEISEISPFVDPVDGVSYRLPSNVEPLHYNLSISSNIHLGELEFSGEVKIKLKVLEPTSTITLHHRYLTILKVDLLRGTGGSIQSNIEPSYIPETEFLQITPRLPLTVDSEVWIVISYTGNLRDDRKGFYRSSYVDTNLGIRKYLAVTQFESTDARHGFPCFDEPRFRSTFLISIKHHKSYHAISNMEVQDEIVESDDYVITNFVETPAMPTYLVAFVVSDYKKVNESSYRAPQQVFAKPQSIDNGEADLAVTIAGRILTQIETYFGLNYRYLQPKMDQVAIPDFAGGAMENWGNSWRLTYRYSTYFVLVCFLLYRSCYIS